MFNYMDATMSRWLILLGGLLVAISASADSDSYFNVVLSGDGEAYKYRVAYRTLEVSLISRCSDGLRSTCALIADPVEKADASAHEKMEDALLLRFKRQKLGSRASADPQLLRAVIADIGYGEESKIEVRSLQNEAIEMAATTKRRISAVEMYGIRGCVLLLTASYRNDWLPWHWPMALAGHPAQYATYYLELYSPDGKLIKELLIRKDLKYSAGFLLPHFEEEHDALFVPNEPC
jgi:hypothetical protein